MNAFLPEKPHSTGESDGGRTRSRPGVARRRPDTTCIAPRFIGATPEYPGDTV